jgi:NTE family protein
VRSLRKRQVIGSLADGRRAGMYVGIRSRVDDFPLDDALDADPGITDTLAGIHTRLARLRPDRQELLVNWGYTICDTGLRAHVAKDLPRGSLPYPARPLTDAATGR